MKVFVYDLGQPAQSWDTVLMPIRMHENSIRIDLTELVKRGDGVCINPSRTFATGSKVLSNFADSHSAASSL